MKIEKAIQWMEKAIQETERDFDLCSPALQKELTEQKEVFETAIAALRSLAKGKDKDVSTLTEQLRQMSVETGSLVCLGCGHEHNCGIHGCALLRQAVETIEKQAAVIDHFREDRKIIPLTLEQLREVPHGKIKDSTLQNIANRANEIASPPAHIDRREWISVKERLPNFGIPVLICWDGYTDIAEYRCGMVCPKWRTQHYGTVDLASVTHWMPFPEPPKEETP